MQGVLGYASGKDEKRHTFYISDHEKIVIHTINILTIISYAIMNRMKSLQTILIFEARKNRSMNDEQSPFKVVMNLINAAVFLRFKLIATHHE